MKQIGNDSAFKQYPIYIKHLDKLLYVQNTSGDSSLKLLNNLEEQSDDYDYDLGLYNLILNHEYIGSGDIKE